MLVHLPDAEWNMDERIEVATTRFDNANTHAGVLAEPCGKHAAPRPGANDDVVERVLHVHAMPSYNGATAMSDRGDLDPRAVKRTLEEERDNLLESSESGADERRRSSSTSKALAGCRGWMHYRFRRWQTQWNPGGK